MLRRVLPLLLGIAFVAAPAGARDHASVLSTKTLKLAARLRQPYARTAVGPDRPLRIAGRSAPIEFLAEEGGLRARIGDEEIPLRPGDSFSAPLDPPDDGEKPETRTLALLRGDPGRGEPEYHVVDRDAREGRIGRESVLFLDFEADGTFLTPFRDLVLAKRGGEIQPVAPLVVLRGDAFDLEGDEAAGRVVATPSPVADDRTVFPDFRGVANGLAHLNDVRRDLGLPPVGLLAKPSADAMQHLRYCARNEYGHREEEGRPGFTREGRSAGISSIGYKGSAGVATVIDGHLGSLLHRLELIDPRLTGVGIAAGSGQVWIHTEGDEKRPWEDRCPVVFPGSEWRSGIYSLDNPDPRPEEVRGTTGLPVTVAFFPPGIRNVRGRLLGPGGEIPCLVRDTARKEIRTNRPELRVALMPRSGLKSGTYRLELTWEDEGIARSLAHDFRIH